MKRVNYTFLVSIFLAFLFGILSVSLYPRLKKKIEISGYTKEKCQKNFQKWNYGDLFLNKDGELLESFMKNNERFVIFFWATWCPFCKPQLEVAKTLTECGIPVIGCPYEKDAEYFDFFIEKKNIEWDNLVQYKDNSKKFIIRKDEFQATLIPSWWVIENGKVKELFVGTKGSNEIIEYFK